MRGKSNVLSGILSNPGQKIPARPALASAGQRIRASQPGPGDNAVFGISLTI